jgi:hypothetical protein
MVSALRMLLLFGIIVQCVGVCDGPIALAASRARTYDIVVTATSKAPGKKTITKSIVLKLTVEEK